MMRKRDASSYLVILATTLSAAGCAPVPEDPVGEQAASPAFEADWASLSRREAAPEWLWTQSENRLTLAAPASKTDTAATVYKIRME
jgi:hypothetical protein